MLTSGFLYRFNPDTFATLSTHVVPNFSGGTAQQLAVTNDGKVLIRDANQAFLLLEKQVCSRAVPREHCRNRHEPGRQSRDHGCRHQSKTIVPLSFYDSLDRHHTDHQRLSVLLAGKFEWRIRHEIPVWTIRAQHRFLVGR